eukprot:CAMPEP_0113685586 /NCGR_PEP_ID=MMETSP0038_2-20120614/14766_1 /TAXON_ID=2898 /ORGANISM="Cryptomonas paramecium" /LENGTH=78 /DNA_ID=CAMNT_0000605713 /DNA_START=124 /DNA_END=360 /DNA_ORIENTATION=- /assembly_acc=CAM_ASM_000170
MAAMDFLNKLASLAEESAHHPDFSVSGYRNVTIKLSTYSIGGLHENDFILAAKSDEIQVDYSPKFLKENPQIIAGRSA